MADTGSGRTCSGSDFVFQSRQVLRHSTMGSPYTRKASFGVPAIPNVILSSVVYLYPTEEAARKGEGFGGCGFLVWAPSPSPGLAGHVYVVTNYHVAVSPPDGRSSPVVRVNTTDGATEIFPLDSSDFEFLPGGGDVAAVELPLNKLAHACTPIHINQLITEENAQALLALGEDVFMIGRFIDHDGGAVNRPAARFGNISIGPTHHPDMPNSGKDVGYYCLDMHSRSGFSGSQVWAYRTAGSDLNWAMSDEEPELHRPIVGLIGIHCSQFPETLHTNEGTTVTGWSGMTAALPAWKIAELLNCEKLHQQRVSSAAAELSRGARRAPVLESAAEPEPSGAFDATLRRMLATPPSRPAKKTA